MFKKLRLRFIALAMASLLVVLLVIIGAINVMNYRHVVQRADETLALLAENGGTFGLPDMQPPDKPEGEDAQQHNGKFPMNGHKDLSAETPYEARYFSVLFDADGKEQSVDTGRIAAVDSLTAVQYAQEIYESGKTKGFFDDYRYTVVSEDGCTRVIFLDCGRSLETFRTFLLASGGVSLLGFISVGALIVAFSGQIVRPVAESYEKQKRFITDAGHEIKTPLAIINADAEVLEMDLGEDNEWLQDIQKQTQRLAGLTNDLVYLSRMEEQQSDAAHVEFPVSDVVSEQAQSFRALAKTQGKTFTENIAPMLTLCGDEKAVRQLTSILLDNAVKYAEGDITVRLYESGKRVCFETENPWNHGLSTAELSRLFDRFYRGDSARTNTEGRSGYGLGLSIAKAIAEKNQAQITAEENYMGNLIFRVTFRREK